MTKYLIFSDLHADKDGLDKLTRHPSFADSKKVCLGDVINAHENCVEYYHQVQEITDEIVMGNHEAVLIDQCDPVIFNPKVQDAIRQTKSELEATQPEFLKLLTDLPKKIEHDEAAFVHGSFNPNKPWKHVRYIEDVKEEAGFIPGKINFLGHGHIPFISYLQNELRYYERQIYDRIFKLDPALTYIINTGSILGSREMRNLEKTCLVFDSGERTVQFFNLAKL